MTDTYFGLLEGALKRAGAYRPVLVIDRDRLDRNIDRMAAGLPKGAMLRIVDKSLPSLPLISRIADRAGTRRLMTFHLPVTRLMLDAYPDADLLFGKPMPVAAVEQALSETKGAVREGLLARTVWLIDTAERLAQYAALAGRLGVRFRIAFEVDAGVRRGGLPSPQALSDLLREARRTPALQIEGLMGYEAHIAEVPGARAEQVRVTQRFNAFLDCLEAGESRILNTGGSKTLRLYGSDTRANDFSAGSGFLLPSDFDRPGLSGFEPAVFIASPVLKVGTADVPGPEALSMLLKRLGLYPRRCCYIYGGAWMARPVHPPGVRENRVWGKSSNQQFLTIPDTSTLAPDDLVFWRPTQSEAVLQQFGPIAVFADGEIVDWWQPIPSG